MMNFAPFTEEIPTQDPPPQEVTSQDQLQLQLLESTKTPQKKTKKKQPFATKYIKFLNSNVETILATSFAVAIGYAFQNFVIATVTGVIEPLIIRFLILIHFNDLYDFTSLISTEKTIIHIKTFISNLITFVICVITVYYINNWLEGM